MAKARDGRVLCQCGHEKIVHEIGTRSGLPVRTWCTIWERRVKCPCKVFAAAVADVSPASSPSPPP